MDFEFLQQNISGFVTTNCTISTCNVKMVAYVDESIPICAHCYEAMLRNIESNALVDKQEDVDWQKNGF